jgi:hypothetical protein
MPSSIIRIASFCLVIVFAWAAGSKILRFHRWRGGLSRYHLGFFELPGAVVVPLAEAAIVVALFLGATKAAAAGTIALLSGFSGAVLRARSFEGDRLPCNCFGRAAAHDYKSMLIRNGLLGVPAAFILLRGRDVTLLGDVRLPRTGQMLPALLIAIGVFLVLALVRTFGQLSKIDR